MSKKSKLNNDNDTPSSQVMLDGYKGHEDVPQNVTNVRFHPSVVHLDCGAFEWRIELREVVLNDGLREIGINAFHKCTSLQEIAIPSTVTKIVYYAFSGCTELKEVVLNEGLQKIGYSAFGNCKALQTFTIPSTVDEISSNAFNYCDNLRMVVLKDGIKRIKEYAFGGCTSLERITIPSTVIEIGKFAFRNCDCLREVVLHNEGVQIGDKAFSGCSSLERFKFPSLSTRLNNIIQAGQRDIEVKLDDVPAVEWRGVDLSIPTIHQLERMIIAGLDKEKLDKIVRLIRYYEIKEATTLFELALWKSKIDQTEDANGNRYAHRIEVPGPVKDTILQYLQ